MKKSLLIALVGFMFIGFASCSCGTKEYKDAKAALEKIEKKAKDAKDCKALDEATVELLAIQLAASNEVKEAVENADKDNNKDNKKDEEKMTDDEKAKITKAAEDVAKVIADKRKELNCDK